MLGKSLVTVSREDAALSVGLNAKPRAFSPRRDAAGDLLRQAIRLRGNLYRIALEPQRAKRNQVGLGSNLIPDTGERPVLGLVNLLATCERHAPSLKASISARKEVYKHRDRVPRGGQSCARSDARRNGLAAGLPGPVKV